MSKWFWYNPLVHAYSKREKRVCSAVAAEHPITAKRFLSAPLRRNFWIFQFRPSISRSKLATKLQKSSLCAPANKQKSQIYSVPAESRLNFFGQNSIDWNQLLAVCRSDKIAFLLALCVCCARVESSLASHRRVGRQSEGMPFSSTSSFHVVNRLI